MTEIGKLIAFACNAKRFAFVISFPYPQRSFWTDWQKFFKLDPSIVSVDMRDQDRESFIGHTGKLLCLCPEIL